eukprot:CAMPEP_0117649598 /NCGR_PEP_ID=MMETSP0804-20121206/1062_1 /TAXON_ID=1074897 /ORGANISM="Tetraselmis astigmatica, Strain CCMP880" /LENGTH=117 /DNA_ID=CAMNT_0005455355 /DNA_START=141 /DNA_END=494 /DNA_ORIENTATION=-
MTTLPGEAARKASSNGEERAQKENLGACQAARALFPVHPDAYPNALFFLLVALVVELPLQTLDKREVYAEPPDAMREVGALGRQAKLEQREVLLVLWSLSADELRVISHVRCENHLL